MNFVAIMPLTQWLGSSYNSGGLLRARRISSGDYFYEILYESQLSAGYHSGSDGAERILTIGAGAVRKPAGGIRTAHDNNLP